jgi:hypothetical protein
MAIHPLLMRPFGAAFFSYFHEFFGMWFAALIIGATA